MLFRSGPADLAASRRMKTTRVGGGHPGYLVRTDPDPENFEAPRVTAQQDPWHYTLARMVEIGGEVRARGVRSDGDDWMIGIENPLLGAEGDTTEIIQEVVRLKDAAIATSGDYRNYFEHDGKRYSHTLDPRTGWPVSHDLAAVSVIAPQAADADAFATALMVLGPAEGMRLAVREEIAARFVLRTEDGLKIAPSPAYEAYLAAR